MNALMSPLPLQTFLDDFTLDQVLANPNLIADQGDNILANAGGPGADFWTMQYVYSQDEPAVTMTAIRKFSEEGMSDRNVLKLGSTMPYTVGFAFENASAEMEFYTAPKQTLCLSYCGAQSLAISAAFLLAGGLSM